MQVARGLLLSVGLLAVAPAHAQNSPMDKVIKMLEDFQAKNEKALNNAEVECVKYTTMATNRIQNFEADITAALENIDQYAAAVADNTAIFNRMTKEVQFHISEIARFETDKSAITDVRGKERTDYMATLTDYNESIDALRRAIEVLKQRLAPTAQAEALLQISALTRVPSELKARIQSYLQQPQRIDGNVDNFDVPQAYAYEFQSGGIVEMLENLLDKFDSERKTLETNEANAKHNYELMFQTLTDEIENNTAESGRKDKVGKAAAADAAAAAHHKSQEEASKAEDEANLREQNTALATRTKDCKALREFMEGEKQAIEKAIEILREVAANPTTRDNAVEFVQVMSELLESPESKESIVNFLRDAGQKLGSSRLTMLAMQAQANPFGKVIKMIKDLVFKLKEEARAEAEQHGWCEKEVSANEITRNAKTAAIEELNERINEAQATRAELKERVATLTEEVAQMTKEMAADKEQRQKESAQNHQTVEDANEGIAGVESAMAVLKEFYENNPVPASALDAVGDHATAGSNILDMLEVVLTDFRRTVTETETMEREAQSASERFQQDGKVSNASKNAMIDGKVSEEKALAHNVENLKEDRAGTTKELDAANKYYDKLKPTCVDEGMSYEERVKAREAEITSLKEALELLKAE